MKSPLRSAILASLAVAGIVAGCSSSGGDDSPAPTLPKKTKTAPAGGTTGAAMGGTTTSGTATADKSGGTGAAPDGAALFAANCAGCHGDKGVGGNKPPKLAGRHLKADEVASIATSGKPPKMPAFGTKLKKEEIDAIGTYVSTL